MSHVEDRWETVVDGQRTRTARYGSGSRWKACWIDPAGKKRSKAFTRRGDAERFLATVTVDVMRGAYLDPRAGKVLLRDFAAAWLEAQTTDPSTQEAMRSRYNVHVLPTLGHLELAAVRPSTVQSWLGGLQGRLAPTYVKVLLANLSAMFGAAVEDGLLTRNPCGARRVRAPRVPQKRVVPWPSDAVRQVIARHPDRYRAAPAVAAGCGLRQGEVFGLRVQDVDFLRRRLHVEQQVKMLRGRPVIAPPKGGKRRTVPLPDHVAAQISERLRLFGPGPDGLILGTRGGGPLTRAHYNPNVWKPVLVSCGLPPDREHGMHALRHYYASVLLDAGESIKAIAEYLGHSDPGFTLRVYTHLLPNTEERARTAVDRALAGPADPPQAPQEAL